MFGKHDHDGIGAREMLGVARRAAPRPATTHRLGRMTRDRAEHVPPMPVRQAQRGGEQWGVPPVEVGEQPEVRSSIDRNLVIAERRETRFAVLQAEEQRPIAGISRLPAKRSILVNRRCAIVPYQGARSWIVA